MPKKPQIAADGRLIGGFVHDAEITQAVFDFSERCIKVEYLSGERHDVTFTGFVYLNASGIFEGNIISEVISMRYYLQNIADIPTQFLDVFTFGRCDMHGFLKTIESHLRRESELIFSAVYCSYGANIGIVSKGLNVDGEVISLVR